MGGGGREGQMILTYITACELWYLIFKVYICLQKESYNDQSMSPRVCSDR